MIFEFFFDFKIKTFLESGQSWVSILIMSIFVVGFIEESIKASVGLAVTNKMDATPNAILLFITCAGSALGFSIIENLHYYNYYGVSVLVSRTFVSSTAHLFFVSVSALLLAKIILKFESDFKRLMLLPIPVLLAATCHGIFNFFLLQNEMNQLSGILIALTMLFALGLYEFWLHILGTDKNLSFALTSCSKCSIIAFSKARFCAFCGTKIQVLRKANVIAHPMPHCPENDSTPQKDDSNT